MIHPTRFAFARPPPATLSKAGSPGHGADPAFHPCREAQVCQRTANAFSSFG